MSKVDLTSELRDKAAFLCKGLRYLKIKRKKGQTGSDVMLEF